MQGIDPLLLVLGVMVVLVVTIRLSVTWLGQRVRQSLAQRQYQKARQRINTSAATGELEHVPQESAGRIRLIIGGAAALLLVAATIGLVFGISEARKLRSDLQWPTTLGTVTDWRWIRTRSVYTLSLMYEYQVNAQSYTRLIDTQITALDQGYIEQTGQTALGRQDTLWYDPTDPTRVSASPYGIGQVGLILALTALGYIVGFGLLWWAMGSAPTVAARVKTV